VIVIQLRNIHYFHLNYCPALPLSLNKFEQMFIFVSFVSLSCLWPWHFTCDGIL